MGQKQRYATELDFSLGIMITMTNLILSDPPLEEPGCRGDGRFRASGRAGVDKEGFSRVGVKQSDT